jgi:hypothetical protein
MSEEGISRRRMLKRIGAGAAVAWTAPIITSLRSPAFAQGSPICDCNSDPCFNECGPPGGGCLCAKAIEGGCDCFIPDCGSFEPCGASSDCGAGRRCVLECCGDPVCATLCSGSRGRSVPRGKAWSRA